MFIAAGHQRAIKISWLHGLCFNIEQSLNNAIISGASCVELQPLYSHCLLQLLFCHYILF